MFFEYDSQNWTTFFWIWLKELIFCQYFFFKKSQIWTLFNMTQRKWTGFPKFDSKNWTLFTKGLEELDPKRLFDFKNKTFLWLEELNFFFVFESKKLSLHFQIYDSNYWTFFWTELTELNTFNNMTHRIGPSLKNMTHRIWTLLFNMSQRKWLHFWSWLKDYFFLHIWLKEQWSFLGNNDPKNWTFLKKHMTQRIGLVSRWLKELNRVSKWLKELNLFFSKWLKELNLFLKRTQRI